MGSGGTSPPFLTSALDGREWSASRAGRFYPRQIALGTHWIGGWVGMKPSLDAIEKTKKSVSCWESNPGRPAGSPSLCRLSYFIRMNQWFFFRNRTLSLRVYVPVYGRAVLLYLPVGMG
jgi:hypothetical protein